MDKLKPCERCGATPEIVERDVEPQGDSWYGKRIERFILCKCGACLFDEFFHEGFTSDDAAIEAWNRRAPSAAERELRDCLRDVLAVALIGPELRNRASALLAKKQ